MEDSKSSTEEDITKTEPNPIHKCRQQKSKPPLEYIKMEDLPSSRFPTEYFGYFYKSSERSSCNPYAISNLRNFILTRQCNFLTAEIKDQILKQIERQETRCFKYLNNYDLFLIIVRLEDITSCYEIGRAHV